jgi:cell division protein FtsL
MAANRKIKKPPSRRLTGVWVLILSLLVSELLFYTWCRVQFVQVGMAISEESRKAASLKTLQSSLKIELARLKAPERISHIARTELGLNMPEPKQVVVIP